MTREIYLDDHATTPIDPEVLEAMHSALSADFGNAASAQHEFGRRAARHVEEARVSVAALIHASPEEIIFTSGATESNNLALKGIARQYRGKGDHLVVSAVEHRSVLDSAKRLESEGFRLSVVSVLPDGRVRPEDIQKVVTDKTLIVSVMAANNEVGTIQPIAGIAAAAHAAGALFHTDATQAVGRVPLDVCALGLDLMSLSAHKMYGPKGVGALYVRSKNPHVRLEPQMDGGGHERDLRSGTLNVPGIAGFGKACEIARRVMAEESRRTAALRDRLRDALLSQLDYAAVNGSMEHRLPNNLNISFAFVESESLLMRIGGVAVSSGAACASASAEPSHVLRALGVPDDRAHGSIRFGLGRFTTREEIDEASQVFVRAVRELRDMSPLYRIAKEGGFAGSVEWTEGATK